MKGLESEIKPMNPQQKKRPTYEVAIEARVCVYRTQKRNICVRELQRIITGEMYIKRYFCNNFALMCLASVAIRIENIRYFILQNKIQNLENSLTNWMEHSLCLEPCTRTGVPRNCPHVMQREGALLRCNTPRLVSVFSQKNPIYILPQYLTSILIISYNLYHVLPFRLLSIRFIHCNVRMTKKSRKMLQFVWK
jgi:hypothetical protein